MSLTSTDNLFSISNQLFDQYRKTLLILSGTAIILISFFWLKNSFFLVLTAWIFNKCWINRRLFSSNQSMKGKTVLITGANTGIGFETAKDLLQRGARVIIACRNLDKGRQAIDKLINSTECEKTNIRLMECDLSSFDSVRNLAKLYNEQEEKLDILICNAGLGYSLPLITKDGFNSVIQSNYLSHFLLTNLLLDKLKQSKSSRILNISSELHKAVKSIDWSDAFTQFNKSRFMGAYAPSKLFQILSTYQLKQNLIDYEDINIFALAPGWVSTSIKDPLEESMGFFTSLIYIPLVYIMKFIFQRTTKTGAQTSIYCAIEPTLDKSKDLYFENCAVAKPSPLSIDPSSAQKLWTITCEAVGLK